MDNIIDEKLEDVALIIAYTNDEEGNNPKLLIEGEELTLDDMMNLGMVILSAWEVFLEGVNISEGDKERIANHFTSTMTRMTQDVSKRIKE